jgi:hypothetical protein
LHAGDELRIRRRLERERFVLPEGASFYDLYERRSEANIGELINIACCLIDLLLFNGIRNHLGLH